MFLRNQWYVGALSEEVGRGLVARTILGQPLVMYRTEAGAPVAMLDRCLHREAPLSLGQLVGDNVQCGYHGLTFDPCGQCVVVPGQSQIPGDARVPTFPVVERWGWVFLWMGEADKADEALLPPFHYTDDPGWHGERTHIHIACDYKLLVDNLLDLSHLSYLHSSTIGQKQVAATPGKTSRTARGVKIERWVMSSPAPTYWGKTRGLEGTVDRWSIAEFVPPSYVLIETGGAPEHSGAQQGDYSQAKLQMVLNGITPETETTTHYFWSTPLDYALDRPDIAAQAFKELYHVLLEDKDMLEAQQKLMKKRLGGYVLDRSHDSAAMEARRIIDRLADGERRPAVAAE